MGSNLNKSSATINDIRPQSSGWLERAIVAFYTVLQSKTQSYSYANMHRHLSLEHAQLLEVISY